MMAGQPAGGGHSALIRNLSGDCVRWGDELQTLRVGVGGLAGSGESGEAGKNKGIGEVERRKAGERFWIGAGGSRRRTEKRRPESDQVKLP